MTRHIKKHLCCFQGNTSVPRPLIQNLYNLLYLSTWTSFSNNDLPIELQACTASSPGTIIAFSCAKSDSWDIPRRTRNSILRKKKQSDFVQEKSNSAWGRWGWDMHMYSRQTSDIMFYNITFANPERWLVKSCAYITQCTHGKFSATCKHRNFSYPSVFDIAIYYIPHNFSFFQIPLVLM